MTEQELQEFCQTLALSPEELSMKNGISTVLWEQGVTHIKVTEAGLDEVVTAEERRRLGSAEAGSSADGGENGQARKRGILCRQDPCAGRRKDRSRRIRRRHA